MNMIHHAYGMARENSKHSIGIYTKLNINSNTCSLTYTKAKQQKLNQSKEYKLYIYKGNKG